MVITFFSRIFLIFLCSMFCFSVHAKSLVDDVVLVAVADKNSSSQFFVSHDKGKTWVGRSIPNFTNKEFTVISCTGKGATAVCAALSRDQELAVSSDGADTWIAKNLNLPAGSILNDVSCTGQDTKAICAAVGYVWDQGMLAAQPLITVSVDGGSTWLIKNIDHENITSDPPANKDIYFLNAISCTGGGKTAVCAAVGGGQSGVVVSNDGGFTWQRKNIQDDVSEPWLFYDFTSVNCTGDKGRTICVAGQKDDDFDYRNKIVVSANQGNTWSYANYKSDYGIDSISCTGNNGNIRCLARGVKGEDFTYRERNNFLLSNDAINWKEVNRDSFYAIGEDRKSQISCIGEGPVSICSYIDRFQTLYLTRDGGKTWSNHFPAMNYIESISCTGSGASDSICIAGGNQGVMTITTDGGKTWYDENLPAANIILTAATGGN